MGILEGSGLPVLYIGCAVPKGYVITIKFKVHPIQATKGLEGE
jgi:hypothetical protein